MQSEAAEPRGRCWRYGNYRVTHQANYQSEAQKYSREVQAVLIFKVADYLRPFFLWSVSQ
jgi:hypothetical protein